MGVKKRNKVSAEFNMSSLTDIIFLLLIFFMLTSSLVTPNALNLSLPGSRTDTPPSTSKATTLKIEKNGTYYLNGTKVSLSAVEKQMRSMKKAKGKDAVMVISPHENAKNDKVVAVLDAAYRYGINASMTEPRG